MIETVLEFIAKYPVGAVCIVIASSLLLFIAAFKGVAFMIAKATKTDKDDKFVEAMYKAIEEHKDSVEALHKVAKKIQEECKK